jgi:hypothetical protein
MKLAYQLIVICVMLPTMPVTSLAGLSQAQPAGALHIAMGDELEDEDDDEEDEGSAPTAWGQPFPPKHHSMASVSHRDAVVKRHRKRQVQRFVGHHHKAGKRHSNPFLHRRRR